MRIYERSCQICKIQQPPWSDLSSQVIGILISLCFANYWIVEGAGSDPEHQGEWISFDYEWFRE